MSDSNDQADDRDGLLNEGEVLVHCDAAYCANARLTLHARADDAGQAEARVMATGAGWRCDDEGDFCPDHA